MYPLVHPPCTLDEPIPLSVNEMELLVLPYSEYAESCAIPSTLFSLIYNTPAFYFQNMPACQAVTYLILKYCMKKNIIC